jgi:ferredoxin
MNEQLRETVKGLFARDEVEVVVSLKLNEGCVAPHMFTKEDDLSTMVHSPKYPIGIVVSMIQEKYPDTKIGVVVRGCDERILIELAKRNQVNLDNIVLVGIACNEEDAKECLCETPFPSKLDIGEKVEGITTDENIEKISQMDMDERFNYWMGQFDKCMKCYGCVSACPTCICDNCILEEDMWVKSGELPPEFPSFHLIRAYHSTDRCVDCHECERACPARIPLVTLYRMIRKDVEDMFGYKIGTDVNEKPPLVTVLEEEG